ncbi:hypothetical protein BSLG_006341 [Batrachochytrium salamandrivorans]|nr:hypothetical protein BSLG_006341 [Batrachochytrium salamandrivorans]
MWAHRVMLTAPSRQIRTTAYNQRITVALPGGFSSCYLISMEVQGTNFNVMVDSGSTDLTIPLAGLNNYDGPTIDTPRPLGGKNLSASYGDSSGWTGYGFQGSASISGTNITANNTPIIGMFQQTTNPVFTSGSTTSQGLLGIAYPVFASYNVAPATAVDAWFAAVRSYFTLDIRSISINSSPVSLPSTFQTVSGYRKWSLIDSCTSVLMVPKVVVSSLLAAVRSSGGIPSDLAASSYYSDFLNGNVGVIPNNAFHWEKLPTLSFDITSDQMATVGSKNATFRITLGPKQYIQPDDNGYYSMIIKPGGDLNAILGVPFFTNLNVVLDRDQGRVGFSLGCGCDTATDGYPTIQNASGTIWKASGAVSSDGRSAHAMDSTFLVVTISIVFALVFTL